jgi:hypothetical protein
MNVDIPHAGAGGPQEYAKRKPSLKHNTMKNAKSVKKPTLGSSSKQKAQNAKNATRKNKMNQGRDPKKLLRKKLQKYREEAQAIYNEDTPSIDKAKGLISLLDKLYHRMPTDKLKEKVEVEIDTNTVAENILNAYMAILNILEEETKEKNIDDLSNLFKEFGF